MNSEVFLTTILAVLVVTLSTLLITRIRREKIRLAALDGINLSNIADILQHSDDEGKVDEAVERTVNLLISSFGCSQLLYLKREKSYLRSIHTFGGGQITGHSEVSRIHELATRLRNSTSPVLLSELADLLPERLYDHTVLINCQICLPVIWKHTLFGLLLVGSSDSGNNRGLALMLTGIGAALTGRGVTNTALANEPSVPLTKSEPSDRASELPRVMLDLIRHREPNTLVERMVETVRDHLRLERVLYLYESKGNSDPIQVVRGAMDQPLPSLNLEDFRSFASAIGGGPETRANPTDELPTVSNRLLAAGMAEIEWTQSLERAGIKYAVLFPPSAERTGIFAWDGPDTARETARSLAHLREAGATLLDNAESFRRIEEMSYTDNLTGLANRRYFTKRLREEIERAGRYRRSLGLIIFDLDELKQVNDRYGHLAGDSVLKRMGMILRISIRAIDVIARYGGDEFCAIMPEADAPTCRRFMDRLVQKISTAKFDLGTRSDSITTTVSIGGALFPIHAEDSEGLIYAADMALLKAKEAGRNRSLLFDQMN